MRMQHLFEVKHVQWEFEMDTRPGNVAWQRVQPDLEAQLNKAVVDGADLVTYVWAYGERLPEDHVEYHIDMKTMEQVNTKNNSKRRIRPVAVLIVPGNQSVAMSE